MIKQHDIILPIQLNNKAWCPDCNAETTVQQLKEFGACAACIRREDRDDEE